MKQEKDLNEKEEKTAQEPAAEAQTAASEAAEAENAPAAEEKEGETDPMEALEQKVAELTDRNLRLMAEFDNYRKRTLKERADLIKTAGENIFVNMLPLIDDFERALKAMETAQDVAAVKEGVQLIYDKFIGFLAQNGVKEIPTENAVFDVDRHEAVTTFPAPSEDMKGKIMDCVTKGYTLNDKVIRYPKVVVCD